jgi:hypothetical protein
VNRAPHVLHLDQYPLHPAPPRASRAESRLDELIISEVDQEAGITLLRQVSLDEIAKKSPET